MGACLLPGSGPTSRRVTRTLATLRRTGKLGPASLSTTQRRLLSVFSAVMPVIDATGKRCFYFGYFLCSPVCGLSVEDWGLCFLGEVSYEIRIP